MLEHEPATWNRDFVLRVVRERSARRMSQVFNADGFARCALVG